MTPWRIIAAAVVLTSSAVLPAHAARSPEIITCGQTGCSDWGWKSSPVKAAKAGKKRQRKVTTGIARHRAVRPAPPREVSLPPYFTTVRCGRGSITVAHTAAKQFEGFCKDAFAIYQFKWVNGYRPGRCATDSKHPCGGAIDIDQSCRSRGPGHCGIPRHFPVAALERIARRHGLLSGSEWRNRDVGHFETRGTLAGSGARQVAEVVKEPASAPQQTPVVAPSEPDPQFGLIQSEVAYSENAEITASVPPPVRKAWPRTLQTASLTVLDHAPDAKPFAPAGTSAEALRRAETDNYLCGVYERTPTKADRGGDFTWKDIFAARKAGKTVCEYVIGGMSRAFRDSLAAAGRIADAAGVKWSILSGYRDDYRQRIATGIKARVGYSLHGGSRRTGPFGNGQAVDVTIVGGDPRSAGDWFARYGRKFGLYRPYPGFDPAHIQSVGGKARRIARKHRHYRVASR